MICPTCSTGVRLDLTSTEAYDDQSTGAGRGGFDISHGFCPECKNIIVLLRRGFYYESDDGFSRNLVTVLSEEVLYPRANPRKLPEEVPLEFRSEFLEAGAVLPVSAKASAALSRRLLQSILRNALGIKRGSLDREIEEFLCSTGVPSHLAEAIDAVRQIGNFAAHPIKDQHTGEVLPVEPGEAEWLLDVIESLVDYVFVQPVRLAQRREVLNQKLAAAGKPALKQRAPNPALSTDG